MGIGSKRLSGAKWLSARPLALLVALCLGTSATAQETLDLAFRPPEVTPDPICVAPRADLAMTAFWSEWSGRTLPDLPEKRIRRDVSRLAQLDGAAWLDTNLRILDLLSERGSSASYETELMLRARALVEAGAFERLTESGVVAELSAMAETLSPFAKVTLAEYLTNGIGIPRDSARADALLVEAGYAGQPQALLALARRQLDGTAPSDWIVPVDFTVTTAFGGLVGDLDPQICDRAAEIATHYENAAVVTRDPQLAYEWYRFAADLGSAQAAWKAAEFHLRADEIEKSNDLLLNYLEQAAAGGIKNAQIELGRIYERGALAAQDLSRARALFEAAAADDSLRGLSQLTHFFDRQDETISGLRAARRDLLTRLIARTDAPGWAFTRLAEMTLEDQGRWTGATAARDLLEEAVLRDDLDGHFDLGRLLLSEAPSPETFDRAVGLLMRVAGESGGMPPMRELHAAFACRAPDGPHLTEAAHWLDQRDALDTGQAPDLSDDLTDLDIAQIQSQAVGGGPDGWAKWVALIETADFADEGMRQFWATRHQRTDAQIVAQALLALDSSPDAATGAMILTGLHAQYRDSGAGFAALLPPALLERLYGHGAAPVLSPEDRAEGLELLNASAALGHGRALLALAAAAPDPAAHRAIYDQYREAIDRDGDFAALVFAARQSETPGVHVSRAAGIMPCIYRRAVDMVDLARDLGDAALVEHWLAIAEGLLGEDPTELTHLARLRLDVEGPAALPQALDLFARASLRGDVAADRELFRLILTPDTPVFNPERAVVMMRDAMEAGRMDTLASYLAGYRSAKAPVQAQIAAQIDIPTAYRVAADSGDPTAMRNHGLHLRETAEGPEALVQAMVWLHRAAEAGDAEAMVAYGQALAFGIGVDPDRTQAVAWLDRAAARGSDEASDLIRLIGLSSAEVSQ
ncbi:hypothetical protein JANAI62_20200 [Jannaschia pagri]|uniref:TPR repeat n=1 Tax=Jannaschia pagri TaxID=2829797 RepID=A0ABQ4NMQ7_9RHOB|nr:MULTISPECIES: hypothetical protein [unclassified Jannaschia]GIT91563.1 hypothetical protein JANAI61_20210 [Jannaschia sp. AI_61]GIT95397.1 hypothetical protein JANAI62_20200 [Jannaschia sp. AI_62]